MHGINSFSVSTLILPPQQCLSGTIVFIVIGRHRPSILEYQAPVRVVPILLSSIMQRRDMQNQSFHYGRPNGQLPACAAKKINSILIKGSRSDKGTHSRRHSRRVKEKIWQETITETHIHICPFILRLLIQKDKRNCKAKSFFFSWK